MDEEFDKAIDQSSENYERVYKKLKYVKSIEGKVELSKGIMMRARDLFREGQQPQKMFKFNIRAYNVESGRWDACPGGIDHEINHLSTKNHEWQGCYKCDILLGSNGIIQSMDHSKGKVKTNGDGEAFGHKVEEKV